MSYARIGSLIVVMTAACSGDNGPSAGATSATSGSGGEFCQKTFGVVVAALESCCTAEDKVTTDYRLSQGIVSSFLPVCTNTLEASITKKRVLYQSDRGEACYSAYASTYAAGQCANITQTFSDPAGTACRQAFVGVGTAGAPCAGDQECTDGLTCVEYTSAKDGTCKAPPAIGEACGVGASTGAGGGSTGSTTLLFGAHPSCAAGARCDSSSHKCVKASADGETCSTDTSCASSHCLIGKCAAALSAEGGGCANHDDCTRGLYCDRATGAAAGACRTKLNVGGACKGAVTSGSECIGRCASGPGQSGQCVSYCGSR